MGLLNHLWDDTVAGPPPESGLGKLRKFASFSPSTSNTPIAPQITRSITMLRTNSLSQPNSTVDSPRSPTSAPESPAGTPTTPTGDLRRFRRKSTADAAERRNPNVYDWMVISSLDR